MFFLYLRYRFFITLEISRFSPLRHRVCYTRLIFSCVFVQVQAIRQLVKQQIAREKLAEKQTMRRLPPHLRPDYKDKVSA